LTLSSPILLNEISSELKRSVWNAFEIFCAIISNVNSIEINLVKEEFVWSTVEINLTPWLIVWSAVEINLAPFSPVLFDERFNSVKEELVSSAVEINLTPFCPMLFDERFN